MTADEDTKWCLVVMAGVRVELPNEHAELLLRETEEPWRELVIPVALAEGKAIAYAWRGIATPRPLSHELFSTVLDLHGIAVEAVRITERQGARFVAELDTSGTGGHHKISCRPSDAVALALRRPLPTPILVASDVFEPPTGVEANAPSKPVVNPLEAAMEAVLEAEMDVKTARPDVPPDPAPDSAANSAAEPASPRSTEPAEESGAPSA
jgi:uncharacterized protein